MSTASPKELASHSNPAFSDEEDKVVFKTPSEASRNGSRGPSSGTPAGSKQSSLVAPAHALFSNGDADDAHASPAVKGATSASPGSQWNFPVKNYGAEADPSWALVEHVRDMKISGEGPPSRGDSSDKANAVLAPAAEIDESSAVGQPHSRQSSEGDSSSFDSPAIPTPGQYKSTINDKNGKGEYGDPQNGYGHQYGYGGQDMGLGGPHQVNGGAHGLQQHQLQAGIHPAALSPLMGPMHGMQSVHGPVPPFSPPIPHHMQHPSMSPDSQTAFPGRPEDFGINYGAQNRMNGRTAIGGRTQQDGAAYATLNGQQNAAGNPPFPYGSPPNQASHPYTAGLMSPTLTSPTFIPNANPYSAIHAPTPYSPYATAQPQAMGGAGQMYEMMAPMSPQANMAGLPNRGQTQARGHGYSASQPPTLREANQGMVMRSPPTRQAQPRPQVPRGSPAVALNHAHSLSLPHSPYSPQLPGIPYAAMSPPPFTGYYHTLQQQLPQQQTLTPELLQAMAGMNMSHPANQAAYNSVQNALGGLQQDPSVMALIQQGGGPSANNRKLGLYKTELCRSWEEKGTCKYGEKCQFAHGDTEQRRVERHPKYKTEICRTFWVSGSCPYGKRCCFIHTELPASAAAGAAGVAEGQRANGTSNGVSNQNERPQVDGRARSMSTNSDPNDHPSSLLARISARAQANVPAPVTPRSSDSSPSNGGLPDSAIADAIARAYSAYGLPAGATSHKLDITPPEPATAQPQSQASNGGFSGFSTRQSSTPASGFGGHHRVSASVDFGRQGRNLGSDLSVGLGSGMGHTRNPSASSVVPSSSYSIPQLSRTPLSGQSSPFGSAGESTSRSVAVGSSLLDNHPW